MLRSRLFFKPHLRFEHFFSTSTFESNLLGAFDNAKNHKRQRRNRQSVSAKRENRKRQSSYRLG